ncbi:hypothetical protein DEO72_LG8g2081 [Vigna unguiculata]|uniref:Uncharacterized protein n=1 Tax=Vigna unguiculata TaxID=3917 RepID=A0A4D6MSJ4_VIGUN|nr:hypothetical protein DEO72_LG8g2081 [Vigna unguiculata]
MIMMAEQGKSRKQHLLSALSHVSRLSDGYSDWGRDGKAWWRSFQTQCGSREKRFEKIGAPRRPATLLVAISTVADGTDVPGMNDDKTAKTDWVTTANGSVQWNLRNPIAVAGATVAGAAVAGAAVVSAAVSRGGAMKVQRLQILRGQGLREGERFGELGSRRHASGGGWRRRWRVPPATGCAVAAPRWSCGVQR